MKYELFFSLKLLVYKVRFLLIYQLDNAQGKVKAPASLADRESKKRSKINQIRNRRQIKQTKTEEGLTESYVFFH